MPKVRLFGPPIQRVNGWLSEEGKRLFDLLRKRLEEALQRSMSDGEVVESLLIARGRQWGKVVGELREEKKAPDHE